MFGRVLNNTFFPRQLYNFHIVDISFLLNEDVEWFPLLVASN